MNAAASSDQITNASLSVIESPGNFCFHRLHQRMFMWRWRHTEKARCNHNRNGLFNFSTQITATAALNPLNYCSRYFDMTSSNVSLNWS